MRFWKPILLGLLILLLAFDLAVAISLASPPGQFDQIQRVVSPDNGWTAIVNQTTNRMDLQNAAGETFPVFPEGTPVGVVSWSPDSRQLLVVRTNWLPSQAGSAVQAGGPIEIWQVRLDPAPIGPPVRLFQSASPPEDGPEQISFGAWSPDSRHVLFWLGILSASIQADGLPAFMLDTATGTTTAVAATALLNPHYQSWASDSSALVITSGGNRSAQVNKWLDLFDVASGQVTTLVSQTQQIPGTVAWSPQGDLIAYAAVPTTETGNDWADLMTFDNPAIARRRIYLLDPVTRRWRRLNNAPDYQDAPLWSEDGRTLYYAQREQDKILLMAADPQTGVAQPVAGSARPAPEAVGYYGQSNWSDLLAYRPTAPRAPVPTLSESYSDLAGHYSLRYPTGWSVSPGWQSWSGWKKGLALSSAPAGSALPAELGPFSGQAFIIIETMTGVTGTVETILDKVLATPGPDQILDDGEPLVDFDRREFQVTGPAGQPVTSTLRLETMDGFGIINHVLIVQHEARSLILRGRGDGRGFEAIAASLQLE